MWLSGQLCALANHFMSSFSTPFFKNDRALNLPPGTMWGVYPAMTTVSVPEPVIVPATTAPREEEC